MNVDWRNRFGWNWISSVRSQGNSSNCWAFGMTALYEAMVRIEHCVWCRRSEGDLARGAGKQASDAGNPTEASGFASEYGLADPDCFPWGTARSLYLAKPHQRGQEALPLSPTPDRKGRTLRVPEVIRISDNSLKKWWIDAVGPTYVGFTLPADFGAYRGNIYTPADSRMGGSHAMLVVGFNDDERYWILKNSWGAGWGEDGYIRISYDANLLESATFFGVRGTNPDPWIKRRHRNGAITESGNGRYANNFELFIKRGSIIEHWWRDNAASAPRPWAKVGIIGKPDDPYSQIRFKDVVDMPAVIQSTFNRNYEIIYRGAGVQGEKNVGALHHIYYDQEHGWWFDGGTFGPKGAGKAVGSPAFIQSNRGAPGDFEVIVLTNTGRLEHWTKHNSWPWTKEPGEWYLKHTFGKNIEFAGPGLIQSKLGVSGEVENGQGELHYVCVNQLGQICHFVSSSPTDDWELLATFGSGITSAPCLIEGQFDAGNELEPGNFELCVVQNGRFEHWWWDCSRQRAWVRSAVFGDRLKRVVGFLQGSFGFNLEVIVERVDGKYQHYWRSDDGWHLGTVIG